MKHGRTMALVAAALVLGLVAGGVVTGGAAPAADSTTAAAPGMGLRMGAAMRDAGGRLADVVADLTGQKVELVVEQRKSGTSFSEIAKKYDVSSDAVVAEALKVRKQVLAARVTEGALTEAQADEAVKRMETRLTERVTATDESCTGTGGGGGKGRGPRDGSGAGRGMGGGRGGGACDGSGAGRGTGARGGACQAAPTATQ